MEGREMAGSTRQNSSRTIVDWLLILGTSGLFVALATMAKLPHMDIGLGWAAALAIAMLALLATCGIALWRTTRFR
jgi:cobalamin biosynthesis protein CbiD